MAKISKFQAELKNYTKEHWKSPVVIFRVPEAIPSVTKKKKKRKYKQMKGKKKNRKGVTKKWIEKKRKMRAKKEKIKYKKTNNI